MANRVKRFLLYTLVFMACLSCEKGNKYDKLVSYQKMDDKIKTISIIPGCSSFILSGTLEISEKYEDLEELNINGTHLHGVYPAAFEKIPNIKRIDFSRNLLFTDIIGIDKLTHLNYIDLSYNNFIDIPSEVLKNTSLDSLKISDNKILLLENSKVNLNNLRYLDLSYNYIKTIPPTFRSMKKMEYLDLSNNKLMELPLEAEELTNLKYLDISGNNFEKIPEVVYQLKSLKKLKIYNQNLHLTEVQKKELQKKLLATEIEL